MEVLKIRKLIVLCCSAVVPLALIAPLPAGASGTGDVAQPKIDRFPARVAYRGSVDIEGHVQGRPQDVEVTLQRRYPHNDFWRNIGSAHTNKQGEVAFHLTGPRYTGRYRLRTADAKGDAETIWVRPRLRLRVNRTEVMEGARIAIEGSLRPAISGRRAILAWRVNGDWRTIDNVRLGDGRFARKLRVGDRGRRRVRITFTRDRYNSWARSSELVRVHRRSPATWYGPGFFGNRMACGQRYNRDMLGVAHRTLRCGTMVSALYKGRSVRVPVVDRGPYGDSQWDLTEETAERLRFSGRQNIGVLVEQ